MSKEWNNGVGQILESKKGRLYINILKPFSVKEGDRLVLTSKKQELQNSMAAGKLSEEKGNELLEKLKFVKYTIHQPPRDDN